MKNIHPLIVLGSTQTADEIADYHSLGFSQTYHLTNEDVFVYGEFKVLGIRIARWENEITVCLITPVSQGDIEYLFNNKNYVMLKNNIGTYSI